MAFVAQAKSCSPANDRFFSENGDKFEKSFEKCNFKCTQDADPQCAFSKEKGKYIPFRNRCVLDSFVCSNPNEGKKITNL